MTDDRSLERAARSWIEAGPSRAPDHVVEHALHLIATTPQERDLRVPRRITMPTIARVAAAAAIGVLLVGGTLFMLRPADQSIGGPSLTPSALPSATARPTVSPTETVVAATPLPLTGPLDPGRYVMKMPDAPVDVEFTIGEGWSSGGWFLSSDSRSISFWTVTDVYSDACDNDSLEPVPGSTVAELVTTLDDQANTDMSTPADVVVDGHPGVRFEITPSDSLPDYCTNLSMWSFPDGSPGRGVALAGSGPGEEVQPVWILEVDGERIVIVVWSTGVSAADGDANTEVIDSMTLTKR